MTVNALAIILACVTGEDRQKDVIAQTVSDTTFDTVTGAELNEDNFALFVVRYEKEKL